MLEQPVRLTCFGYRSCKKHRGFESHHLDSEKPTLSNGDSRKDYNTALGNLVKPSPFQGGVMSSNLIRSTIKLEYSVIG